MRTVKTQTRPTRKRSARGDFSVSSKKRNPYRSTSWIERYKPFFALGAGCMAALITGYLLFFHSLFQIKTYQITGLERLTDEQFQEAIDAMLDKHAYLFIPASNYFVLDTQELEELLAERFGLETISVSRSFPQTLDVTIQEKISTIVYTNGQTYAHLGATGRVVEQVRSVMTTEWVAQTQERTVTSEDGEDTTELVTVGQEFRPDYGVLFGESDPFPVIYDERELPIESDAQQIRPEIADGVIAWHTALVRTTEIRPTYVALQDERGYGHIHTNAGWTIKADLLAAPGPQLDRMDYLFSSGQANPEALSYIDLRFGEQVYWK
jgi:hypothetical protein